MKKIIRWGGLFGLVLWAATVLADVQSGTALNLSDPIPVGPQVQVGQLANGLTYYIQKNVRPQKRLELRLVVKAGSVLEDDDQLGLAHFVEHMAFNGSTHFKKHELVSYLQSVGLKFGADLNAYTGFNETVYILPLPTDNDEVVQRGFLVLQDWAQGIAFEGAAVDAERSIVLEELRLGKGAQDRMNKVLLPKILGGSQYAQRMPIGTEDNLKGFQVEAIKRFYKDWYRPNLMAVVVVGDIEPAQAQALIEANFAQLKNPANERPRTYPELPVRTTSEAVVVTDPEATNNVMQILYPVTAQQPVTTIGGYRQTLVERLFGMMLGQRTQELTQQPKPPFVGGGSGVGKSMPGYRAFSASALLGRQGLEPAVSALVQENERARVFGFSEAELQRAKKNALRAVEHAKVERDTTDSGTYAAEYIRNFLEHEEIPGIDAEFAYNLALLPTITLEDVNTFAKEVIPNPSAKLVIYTGVQPPQADTATPTPDQLLGAVQRAEQLPVTAKVQRAVVAALMEKPPAAGSVVAERRNAALGVLEWDLSNGLKVILKPTDFQTDQILVSAERFGGQSLYDQTDRFNAAYAASVVGSMGLADFSPSDLQNTLAGKAFSVATGSADWVDSISAASSNADMQSMLQVLYLKFGKIRRDPDLFQSFVTRSQDAARNAMARPESVFHDALATTLYNAHPRLWLTPRPQDFASLSLDRIQTIYEDRFHSAKGFTFVFVGNFKPEALKPLVATYIASLPTADLPLNFMDRGIRPAAGVVKKVVHAGTEVKALVSISFAGAAPYSTDAQNAVRALVDVMNLRIIDVLREKLTLIYGGGLAGGLGRLPYDNYNLQLSLPCGPQNVDQVIAAVFAEIQSLQDQGPALADLNKVKQNWRLAHRKSLREDGYWQGLLQAADLFGTDPAEVLSFEARVAALSPADVQAAAKKYLRQDNYVQMVLLPVAAGLPEPVPALAQPLTKAPTPATGQ